MNDVQWIYLLEHVRELDRWESSVFERKFIGAFAELGDVEAAMIELDRTPGFRDFPSGFRISRLQIDRLVIDESFVQTQSHPD